MIVIRIISDRKVEGQRVVAAVRIDRARKRERPDIILSQVTDLPIWAGAENDEVLRLVGKALE